ncbi:DUF2497 domain-containing protein [Gluconobacter sphaericus]|uniref:DUF2497 domain-containing protein n=1 Tax=Gluconobacter sphaericus TaxID=574987 RepID=UPI001B8C3947|nr:DUF2497 domain-containing protein [Gluconobacter sphaericus]MBS1084929.1 DUF2497 domain-containing protein [Gluconobacter sphaericus]MBS1098853.1 DUF2497 domain-containing protein [Gluconobacter sphaericus]
MTSSESIQQDQHADDAMTDVLSSIRRALHEDPTSPESTEDKPNMSPQKEELTLDNSMMVAPPVIAGPIETAAASASEAPPTAQPAQNELKKNDLMNAQTVAAAERSLDELHAAFSEATPLASDTVISRSSGLTIEDMVRGEVRSMVRTWLDAHLPSLVEILVRAEIARLRPRE